jgi:hypothetical protein
MLTFSVWNDARREYDYYQAPGTQTIHAPTPTAPSGTSVLGATPEEVAWKLPHGARRVGHGAMPKGRIASFGASDVDASFPTWIAYVAAGYFAWRFFL